MCKLGTLVNSLTWALRQLMTSIHNHMREATTWLPSCNELLLTNDSSPNHHLPANLNWLNMAASTLTLLPPRGGVYLPSVNLGWPWGALTNRTGQNGCDASSRPTCRRTAWFFSFVGLLAFKSQVPYKRWDSSPYCGVRSPRQIGRLWMRRLRVGGGSTVEPWSSRYPREWRSHLRSGFCWFRQRGADPRSIQPNPARIPDWPNCE